MVRFYTFLLFGLCCLLGGHSLHAQLNPGDIMFVGFRFDGTAGDLGCEDGIAFAALVDIPANTTIYFTEDEYNGTAFGTDEGTISWTNTALTPAGTVVALTTHVQTNADFCNGTNPGPTANFGTIQFETNMDTQPWNIGTSNQEIYAYLGAPLMPTTWLCAMYTDNLDNSNTPPAELSGLILDFSNVDQDADLGMYTGALDCADRNACLANILNLANWTTENEPGVSDCCDDNGVDYPGDLPEGFFQCEQPVINGVTLVDCGNGVSGDVTLEIDGELNGAAQWEWLFLDENCSSGPSGVYSTGSVVTANYFDYIDTEFIVRANGGCLTEPVCFTFIPSQLTGQPAALTLATGTYCVDAGVQAGLGGGSPAGGVYSGPGVTDDGNGMTFSFDPAVAGTGSAAITYTYDTGTACGDSEVQATIQVAALPTATFSAPGPFNTTDGLQALTGGMPAGGTYSGTGVVDNGDGTYSFDPSVGAGTYTITYSYTDPDGTNCMASVADDIVVESCVAPVINGINLIGCNGPDFTIEVDGELNGAAEWQWTNIATGSTCEQVGFFATGTQASGDYLFAPDDTFFVRAAGGCLEAPVCLAFVPNELIADDLGVSFTAPGPFTTTDAPQPLTGGMPEGGSYSGMGVTDNSDGTFSFDPSIGAGTYTIIYTYQDMNGCAAFATGDIIVEEAMLVTGDLCTDATDINAQFGQAPGEVQSSGPYDNTDATTDDSDPDFGWECFGEPDGGGSAPSLERTLWYTFEGDGNRYFIEALACGDDPIDFGDTQFAIYTGGCDSLEAVLCSEDGPNTMSGGPFPAGDTLQTEAGVTYYIMVDGFGPDFAADGEFCIEVTKLTEPVVPTTVTFQVDASRLAAAGVLSPEGLFVAGEFNGWPNPGTAMAEGMNNIWSITLEVPANDTFEYKFQNGTDGWENIDVSIGDPCTLGEFGNRFVVVEDMDVTTDLVCFNYCVTCDMVVNTSEAALQAGVSVFPNPVQDILNVQIDLPTAAESLSLRLMNTLGQVVLSSNYGQLQSGNIELDVSQLPTGTYLLQVIDGQAQFARPVVVQR